ncbi:death-associated inhibitor of apoptosis 1-like [Neocloeon triangulifer]|uniref:death-associated inhibitor of apoptosis 1-like n=1 Tax=Neocloeon triangulifer TaxID=2078957 RepID=UPI00286F39F2|nr:death-associated inhibitor of apoptosis 1-like [Neocloeon triangulifer]
MVSRTREDLYSLLELPKDRPLNLNLELHRCLTYPCDFEKRYPGVKPFELANLGFYFTNERLHCQFCDKSEIKVENHLQLKERHNCVNSSRQNIFKFKSMIEDYKFEAHRLHSFQNMNWVNTNCPISWVELAIDGFYFMNKIGEDTCKCYFCQVEIKEWKEDDTVREEHIKFTKKCSFLKNPAITNNIIIGTEIQPCSSDGIGKNKTGAQPIPEDEMKTIAQNAPNPAPNGNPQPAESPANDVPPGNDQAVNEENPANGGEQ